MQCFELIVCPRCFDPQGVRLDNEDSELLFDTEISQIFIININFIVITTAVATVAINFTLAADFILASVEFEITP